MSTSHHSLATSRRRLLTSGGGLLLSASALALLGQLGWEILDQQSGPANMRVGEIRLVIKEKVARHNELLIATVRQLGGEPVTEKSEAEYARSLNMDRLQTQNELLDLAATLELGATNAYLGVIPALQDQRLAQVAARLAADEASHWALLNFDLGRPFMPALGFGA